MGSRLPLLNSCCCGCSLETGSKIIGFLELGMCSVVFVLGMINTVQVASLSTGNLYLRNLLLATSMYVELFTLMEIIFAVYLLYGIYKSKPKYIKVWVLVQFALLIVALFSDILFVIFYYTIDGHSMVLPEEILLTLVHMYSILVVHSYYVSFSGREILHSV